MKNLGLLLLLTIFCSYCKSTKPALLNKETSIHNKSLPLNYGVELTGNWELKSLWGVEEDKVSKAFINMNFETKSFTGNTGCNNISGTFSFKEELLIIDKNISIDKNNCPAYMDKKFVSMLMKINKFQIQNNALELSQDNIVLMSFKRN